MFLAWQNDVMRVAVCDVQRDDTIVSNISDEKREGLIDKL